MQRRLSLDLPPGGRRRSPRQATLERKYKVERLLQKALFGEILLARPLCQPDTLVVLKAVSKRLVAQGLCVKGTKVFENNATELDVLKKVRELPHPHLLGLADAEFQFETRHTRYIALPYAQGGELFGAVEAKGALGEVAARSLCCGVAEALCHLHMRLGYAHNDVSLENILLNCGSPVLCDYGLATKIGAKWNSKRRISGKLPYQAPEVYFGTATKSTGQVDVFSLGVVVFVLLCGIPPFDFPDLATDQRYAYIQMGRLQELLRLWGKQVSAPAVDLLQRMLTHDPHLRITIEGVLAHPWVNRRLVNCQVAHVNDVEMEMDMGDMMESEDKSVMVHECTDETLPGLIPGMSDTQTVEHQMVMAAEKTHTTPVPISPRSSPKGTHNYASPDSVFSFERAYLNHTRAVAIDWSHQ